MTTQTTRWGLDTCDCVIEYNWDDTLPESSRVHTPIRYPFRCPAHSILPTDTDRWNCLLEENTVRKHDSLVTALANAPTTLYDIVNGNRRLKEAFGFNFLFSGTAPNRVLTISFSGISLTGNQKNTIQTALNTRFGSGSVLIV